MAAVFPLGATLIQFWGGQPLPQGPGVTCPPPTPFFPNRQEGSWLQAQALSRAHLSWNPSS